MAIKEKEVWVSCKGNTKKYYESKGYTYPTYINKQGKICVNQSAKILVKVEDLLEKSNIPVTKICDICGNENPKPQSYDTITRSRNTTDGLDRCFICRSQYIGMKLSTANESTCIATTRPEFVKLFWKEEDTLKFTYSSTRKVDFKCPECGNKVENKSIYNVYRQGVPCPCSDGISYPEKFMYFLLTQLNVRFDFQKSFTWSKNKKDKNPKWKGTKRYDFYIRELNMIIETHGRQHSGVGFERYGGRTLEEEQANDKIKESLAKENGIIHYISVDCKRSEMNFIKSNILDSLLNHLFNLSEIDWLKCHEFACKSLVKKACELWNEGHYTGKISAILNLEATAIRRYLKQGAILGLCDYDPIEAQENGIKAANELNNKPVIQLSLNGDFIKEWKSTAYAGKKLSIVPPTISAVCHGRKKTAGGYIWVLKTDYSPMKAIEKAENIDRVDHKRSIVRLSIDGELIDEWESITIAATELGISRTNISSVCSGRKKTAGSYIWMYKTDYCPIKALEKAKNSVYVKLGKPIVQLSIHGDFIREWDNGADVQKELGIFSKNISKVLNGKRNQAGGFIWMYKTDYSPIKALDIAKTLEKAKIMAIHHKKKPIIQLSINGEFIKEWDSAVEVFNELAINTAKISSVCNGKRKTTGGFKWMFKEDYEKLGKKDL